MRSAIALAVALMGRPVYGAGKVYAPEGILSTGAGTNTASAVVRLHPGGIRRPVTVDQLSLELTAGAIAGGFFQIAIYKAHPVTGDPTGDPVYVSANQSTAAGGVLDIAVAALRLGAGEYWWGVMVDATAGGVAFRSPTDGWLAFANRAGCATSAQAVAAASTVILTKAAAGYGVWPTFTGNRTNDGLAHNATRAGANIVFRAA